MKYKYFFTRVEFSSICSLVFSSDIEFLLPAFLNIYMFFLLYMTQLLSVRVGSLPSTSLSTGAPQGCVVLLDSLHTYDCVATSHNTSIFKFADDTVVVGLISHNVEKAFLEEIGNLENNLLLNIRKTKELIVDFSTKQVRNYNHQWRE